MEFGAAQREMVAAFVNGAPGVLVSGLVWLVAGSVWMVSGPGSGFAVLFVGGMLIFPVSLAVARLVFGAPKVASGNALERLGLESTFVLIGGIITGYALLRATPDLAFAAMAIAIGTRYFAFRTLYDEPVYWALGGLLAAVGVVVALRLAPLPINLAMVVGCIETGFAGLLFARWKVR